MADIKNLNIDGELYDIKDETARNDLTALEAKSVTCDLEGATEDESTVPVNADTLGGKLHTEYLQHNAITATLQQNIGTLTEVTSLPLTLKYKVGTAFEMTADGKIKCLNDGYILISAAVMISNGGSNVYTGFFIDNNDSDVETYFSYVGGDYGCIGMPSKMVPVSGGDVLSIRVQGVGATINSNARTHMTAIYV